MLRIVLQFLSFGKRGMVLLGIAEARCVVFRVSPWLTSVERSVLDSV